MHRIGTRSLQVSGALMSVAGLALLMQVDAETRYWSGIVPGLTLFGLGLMALNVPAQITAVVNVVHDLADAAAGVVSAAFAAINIVVGLLAPDHKPTTEEIAEGAAA